MFYKRTIIFSKIYHNWIKCSNFVTLKPKVTFDETRK